MIYDEPLTIPYYTLLIKIAKFDNDFDIFNGKEGAADKRESFQMIADKLAEVTKGLNCCFTIIKFESCYLF